MSTSQAEAAVALVIADPAGLAAVEDAMRDGPAMARTAVSL